MTEIPISEIIETLTGASLDSVGEPEMQKESMNKCLVSLRNLYNSVLGDIPERALDEEYERRDKFILDKV
jgi:hypothetical protein